MADRHPEPRAPAWQDYAACAGHPTPQLWFPTNDEGQAAAAQEARNICAGCPVRDPCLEYAVANREQHGIWGGTTERERRKIRKQRRRQGTM